MQVTTVVVLSLALVFLTEGAYVLQTEYSGSSFFNGFDFFTANDPTHGFVNFVDQRTAVNQGLIKMNGQSVYIGADYTTIVANGARGRNAIRLSSKQSWSNGGLFILDLTHMPTGCGTWPAWWLVGPNWPNNGEIDIIEGINTNSFVTTTLHTSNGCTMSQEDPSKFTGKWGTGKNGKPSTDCYIGDGNQYNNEGCGIIGADGSYGAPFNAQNGGVYVMEWTSSFIRAFYFPRNRIPGDINSGQPQPNNWGKPYSHFDIGSNCPMNHFQSMQIIFDLTFCGDWAGQTFSSQCPGKGDCNSFVKNNPKAFQESYWAINSLKVYENH